MRHLAVSGGARGAAVWKANPGLFIRDKTRRRALLPIRYITCRFLCGKLYHKQSVAGNARGALQYSHFMDRLPITASISWASYMPMVAYMLSSNLADRPMLVASSRHFAQSKPRRGK